MTVQRSYADRDGTTRHVQMDDRTIGGGAGDVPLVRDVGGPLDFGSSSTGNVFDGKTSANVATAPQNSGDIDCDGFETVVVRVEASAQGATIKVQPWLKDASGTYMPQATETVSVTTVQDSGAWPTKKTSHYHCIPLVLPTRGAKSMRFRLTTLSQGTVSMWAVAR